MKTKDEILEKRINKKIEKMTLREKISQTLILGFHGSTMNKELSNLISDIKPGGLILFDRNIDDIDQLAALNKSIFNLNTDNDNIPIFIAIDEEGGVVSRLSKIYGELPSMLKLGNKNDETISLLYGKILGLRLRHLGFNLNFAPVVDVNYNLNNPIMGARSIGNNTDVVSKNAFQIIKGLNSENIILTIKHFPGHGSTSIDSHKDIPVINKSIDELKKSDLIPFEYMIKNNIDMIMVGHLLYDKIDKNNISSLSENIKTGILRKDLDFSGVIISDDLTMKAVIKNKSIEEAVYQYLKTGGDLALVCHNTDDILETVDYIENKIINKDFTENDLNNKIRRILIIKDKYKLKDKYLKYDNQLNEIYELQKRLIEEFNN